MYSDILKHLFQKQKRLLSTQVCDGQYGLISIQYLFREMKNFSLQILKNTLKKELSKNSFKKAFIIEGKDYVMIV